MTILLDHQFELDGYVFGLAAPFSVTEDGFDNGTAEWVDQDGFAAGTGARQFGRDVLQGPTWSFSAFTDGSDIDSALAILAEATRAWRGSMISLRDRPGAYQTLRYAVAGRTRRVYGRAKRIGGPPTNLILSGMVPVVGTFDCVDALHYEDTEKTITLNAVSWSGVGGLLPPLAEPLTTEMDSGPREGSQVIGGDMATPAIITFRGPVINPFLTINGSKIQLLTTIAYDQSIVIDARPWVNTVKIVGGGQTGASMGGKLSRGSQLSKAVLEPGPAFFIYGGIDGTGTSTVEVKWRPAWSSL